MGRNDDDDDKDGDDDDDDDNDDKDDDKVVAIIDCLQSAFSFKICLVLTSSSAIANHDVIITIRD